MRWPLTVHPAFWNLGPTRLLVTTSKALVTSSDAPVSNSFLLLLVRHLLLAPVCNQAFFGGWPSEACFGNHEADVGLPALKKRLERWHERASAIKG